MAESTTKRPAWPPGHDVKSYTRLIRAAFEGSIERANEAAITMDEESFADWALALQAARDDFDRALIEELPKNAIGMVGLAIESTLACEANGPLGLHDVVQGGIIPRWVDVAVQLDPEFLERKPRKLKSIARRIALAWSMPDNPDRESVESTVILDDAASQLVLQSDEMGDVEQVRGLARSLLAPWRVDRDLSTSWAAIDRWAPLTSLAKRSRKPAMERADKAAKAAFRIGRAAKQTSDGIITTLKAFERVFDAFQTSSTRTARKLLREID